MPVVFKAAVKVFEARETVEEMLGEFNPSDPNLPFYLAFAHPWDKATTVAKKFISIG